MLINAQTRQVMNAAFMRANVSGCGRGRRANRFCVSLRDQLLQCCIVRRGAISRHAQACQTKAVARQFVRPQQLSAGQFETMKMTAGIGKNMRIIAGQRNEIAAADKAAPDFSRPDVMAV